MCSSASEKVWRNLQRTDKEKLKILVAYNEVFLKKSVTEINTRKNPFLWYTHNFRTYSIYKNQEINVGVIKDSSLKRSVAMKKQVEGSGENSAKEKIICPPKHPRNTHTFNIFDTVHLTQSCKFTE